MTKIHFLGVEKKDDLFDKGYWLGVEGGGPYQYQANLVSRPNIAFARLDPQKFCFACV